MANEVNVSGARPARRTIVKGAAWAVPAVAVISATPAFAASPPDIIDWEDSTACKIPGSSHSALCYDKGYVLFAKFENPTTQTLTLSVTGVTVGGVSRCIVGLTDTAVDCDAAIPNNLVLAPGEVRYIAIYTNSSTDSSSTNVTVAFNYQVGAQPVQQGTTSGDVGGSPWQGSCRHACTSGDPLSACGTGCASSASTATVEEPAVEEPAAETTVEEPAAEETDAPATEEAPETPATEEPTNDAPPSDEESQQTTDTSEATATPNN